ncbi:hypothetical protein NLG42_09185 [Flavobacterium plurextorum]|uniref:hypothetical protein n=1 Tax=Flavobacterium plurextorum TaxID=1114867 RepID=UPI00214D44F0|nr:hypothetical protein [Flavobacterium plurextorum]UUW10974.1 hypothetical protein NLG42_09185 [Flavobacterium plurextorum]
MKTHTIMILLFHFFCLTGCENNKKTNERQMDDIRIDKIVINYQDLDVETPIRIDCEDFDNYFNKSIKTRVINDFKVINKLVNYISEAKENNKKVSQIDVRFKMRITYSNGTIKEFCGNDFAIEVDKSNYQIDMNFLNYIKSILK